MELVIQNLNYKIKNIKRKHLIMAEKVIIGLIITLIMTSFVVLFIGRLDDIRNGLESTL